MAMKIYTNRLSQPSRALLILCDLSKIPYEEKRISLADDEHLEPWFLKLNPAHQVPVIEDDAFVLAESEAIVKYLIAKHEIEDHWYPADLQQRAKIDQFLSWQHVNLRKKLMVIYREEVLEVRKGNKVDKEKVEEGLKQLEDTLDFLEIHFLGKKKYLCGEEISVADLFAICEIMQMTACGKDVLKDHQKLKQWTDRVREATNPVFDEIHAECFKSRKDESAAPEKK